jgi:hypothetical protein
MGDVPEEGGLRTLDAQVAALKSSSTNLRIDVLRKLLLEIQNTGTYEKEYKE